MEYSSSFIQKNKRFVRSCLVIVQDNKCYYCKRIMVRDTKANRYSSLLPTLDHLVPLYRDGEWKMTNLVVACSRCNNLKGHMPAGDFIAMLERKRLVQGRQPVFSPIAQAVRAQL